MLHRQRFCHRFQNPTASPARTGEPVPAPRGQPGSRSKSAVQPGAAPRPYLMAYGGARENKLQAAIHPELQHTQTSFPPGPAPPNFSTCLCLCLPAPYPHVPHVPGRSLQVTFRTSLCPTGLCSSTLGQRTPGARVYNSEAASLQFTPSASETNGQEPNSGPSVTCSCSTLFLASGVALAG